VQALLALAALADASTLAVIFLLVIFFVVIAAAGSSICSLGDSTSTCCSNARAAGRLRAQSGDEI
jgi:hypothetical protein